MSIPWPTISGVLGIINKFNPEIIRKAHSYVRRLSLASVIAISATSVVLMTVYAYLRIYTTFLSMLSLEYDIMLFSGLSICSITLCVDSLIRHREVISLIYNELNARLEDVEL